MTDVGTSSSYSFNGLSLKPGSSYYFSIRAYDRLGNPSETISTDGFLIDMVGPNVLGVSVPTDKILAIYEPISIDVFLSEIAKSAEVEFRTERANIFNLEPDYK
ncbi:hypothetical protein CM15mP37_04880 [bacterium]|nr:MAG: hypothetical protein CM15mP37_04880 [bacterium]